MDEFVERLAGIRIPALIFLIVMSTTGLAGAGSSIIAKYGYSAIITAVCKKIMEKDNLSADEMCAKVDKYPITKALKEKVKSKIRAC